MSLNATLKACAHTNAQNIYLFIVREGKVHACKAYVSIAHCIHVHFLRLQSMHVDEVQIAIVTNSHDQSSTVAGENAAL